MHNLALTVPCNPTCNASVHAFFSHINGIHAIEAVHMAVALLYTTALIIY